MNEVQHKGNVLILGVGKSGTTALHQCVRGALSRHTGRRVPELFEPKSQEVIDQFLSAVKGPSVTKILAERFVRLDRSRVLAGYDRKVFIVRDPRDTIISRIMWMVATRLHLAESEDRQRIRALLVQKQADPASLSLLQICQEANALLQSRDFAEACRKVSIWPATLLPELGDQFHVFHFEQLVDGDLEGLSSYLGVALQVGFAMGKRDRLLRSGTYGGWKNWMLPVDHSFFVDQEILRALGYHDIAPYEGPRSITYEESVGFLDKTEAVRARAERSKRHRSLLAG